MSRSLTTKYTLGALAGLSLIGTLAGCSTATDAATDDTTSGNGSSESSTDTGTDTGTSTDSGSTAGSDYTDGSYSAEGSYSSPGGTESIGVELTLEGGVVTEVTVTPEATSGNAVRYQNDFADGIAAEVVGENIDDLNVDRVAGSSLTSGGFNEAVETIKADAAA